MSRELKWLFGSKRIRREAQKRAAHYADRAKPIVQTIQAGLGVYGAAKMMTNADGVTDVIKGAAATATAVADFAKTFVPSMQVITRSFADSTRIFSSFGALATAAGIGANMVLTFQGVRALQIIGARLEGMATSLAAQTALLAQENFPRYVHDMVRERIAQTALDPVHDHWFFVYHPDNDWYPGFYHLLRREPIAQGFCGYTNQIDAAFVFLLAARRRINEQRRRAKSKGRSHRPVKLHLLVPAYQPIIIFEALKIPEDVGDFVIEGRISNNAPFVWLNLPEDQKRYTQDIGQFLPPSQGWFERAMATIGLAARPPRLGPRRVLGTKQGLLPLREGSSISTGRGDEHDDEFHPDQKTDRATPLQHQYS